MSVRRALALIVVTLLATAPAAWAQETPAGDPTPTAPVEPTPTPGDGTPAEHVEPGGDEVPDGEVPIDGEEEEPPPPRCAASEVDLTPDDETATCIPQAELSGLLDGFEAAAGEEAEALGELSEVLNALAELEAELEALTARVADVRIRQGAAMADARFADIRTSIAREGLADIEVVLASEEDLLREQAIESYIGGESDGASQLARTLSVESVTALGTLRQYASVIVENQQRSVSAVDALRIAAVQMEAAVKAIEAQAQVDAAAVDRIEGELSVLLAAEAQLVADAQNEAAQLAERIAEIQQRKTTFAQALNISGVGGGAVGALLQQVQSGQVPPTELGFLVPPVLPVHISSAFGPRRHPIFADTRLHTGLDMSASAGDAIHAAAQGMVVMAEEVSGYGNLVVIDHGNTIGTLYAHLTADAVQVGDELEVGDLVGFAGSTGYSTGPHLHFEVRVLGQPVDPLPYLVLAEEDPEDDDPLS